MRSLNKTHDSGFSLMEILVSLGVSAVVITGATLAITNISKFQRDIQLRESAMSLRNQFYSAIIDTGNWALPAVGGLATNTINDAVVNPSGTTNFTCVRNSTNCTAISNSTPSYPFVLKVRGAGGYELLNGTYDPIANPNQGFTHMGVVCNGFVQPPAAGNPACPIRFTFLWSPFCSTTSCTNPTMLVAINFIYNGGTNQNASVALNPNVYGIPMIIRKVSSLDIATMNALCAATSQGTYNPVTQMCTIAVAPAPAPVPVPVPVPVPFPVPGPPPCTTSSCSDIRVKKDVRPFTLGLSEVLQLKTMTYKYNGLAGSPNDDQDYTGVIAQELQVVAPVLVQERSGIKSVDYHGLSMMLVNSIQELNKRIETLEKENRQLKERNK